MKIKNQITTQGYFIKRLRDSGFDTVRLFDGYGVQDPRKWTLLIDPKGISLLLTCYENKEFKGDVIFEFHDGGNRFPKNWNLKTDSMEIIITTLVERGVPQK